MSTVTPYLNLVKPAPLENFSRATYNTNLDLIDAGIVENGNRKVRHAEYTGGSVTHPANTLWGVGTLAQDNASTINNDFSSQNGISDGFTISKSGLYLVQAFLAGTGATPQGWVSIRNDGGGNYVEENVGGTSSWNASVMTVVYVASAVNIQIKTTFTASYVATSRIRLTKLQG